MPSQTPRACSPVHRRALGTGTLRTLAAIVGMILAPLHPSCAEAMADEPATPPPPIPVVAQVPARTYYVGQAIELRIGAEAEGVRPEVVPPTIPDADVTLIDRSLKPLAVSGIGASTSERNLFITRFRVIPHRAGPLRIPPVRARLGPRSGASRPLQIAVERPPVAGRPAEFLGGVGDFTVEAEATPTAIRVGQDLIFTLAVTGPAARGMAQGPRLSRFSQLPLRLQIEPMAPVATENPPARRFRYRLRPTRAGVAALPPVAVASFDPQTKQYITRVTSSIPIRVVDVPRFDPRQLDYRATAEPQFRRRPASRPLLLGLLTVLGLLGAIAVIMLGQILHRRHRRDPRRLLARAARRLDPRHDVERTARRINDSLAAYLELTRGRPRGPLTPDEARSAFADATEDTELARRCARLVGDCDRACYSGRAYRAEILVEEARSVFRAIVAKRIR